MVRDRVRQLAGRVRQRRREEEAAEAGEKRKRTIAGGGSFMGGDLWERVGRGG
jgi:hypothetical protein